MVMHPKLNENFLTHVLFIKDGPSTFVDLC